MCTTCTILCGVTNNTTCLGDNEFADNTTYGENVGDMRGTTPIDGDITPNVDEMRGSGLSDRDTSVGE